MDIRAGAPWTWLETAVGALLIGLVLAELVISSSPVQQAEHGVSVDVKSTLLTDQASTIRITISHGSSDRSLDIAAFPLGDKPVRPLSVYVYNDFRFPAANVAPTVPQGIFDHLSGELMVRQYGPSVVAVSAQGMADVLLNTAAAPGMVMMTGVLPASVFSSTTDLISPWVHAGGVAVWGGGAIGFWSGRNGQLLSTEDALGQAGTERLLGSNVVQYPSGFGRQGDVQSAFASALGVAYNFTGSGVLLSSARAHGGLDLGWDSGQLTSVAYLPRGLGGFLIFGGEIPDEGSVAVDVTRILMSGAIYGTGQVASKHLTLAGSASRETVDWGLPFPVSSGGIMLVAFDPISDAPYFFKRQINRWGAM